MQIIVGCVNLILFHYCFLILILISSGFTLSWSVRNFEYNHPSRRKQKKKHSNIIKR